MKNKTLQQAFPIVAAAFGNRFGIKVSVLTYEILAPTIAAQLKFTAYSYAENSA